MLMIRTAVESQREGNEKLEDNRALQETIRQGSIPPTRPSVCPVLLKERLTLKLLLNSILSPPSLASDDNGRIHVNCDGEGVLSQGPGGNGCSYIY